MKLSGLRPDMDKTNDASVTHAIETVKEINGVTLTQAPTTGIQEKKLDKPAPSEQGDVITMEDKNSRAMTSAESLAYANTGVMEYITSRITELNEGLEAVQLEANTIKESEALLMVLAELERVKCNIPGYQDSAYSRVS